VTDLQDVASIRPRELVPTTRQLATGATVRDYEFVPVVDDGGPRFNPIDAFRKWAADADPRSIEGPKIPLLVLALGAFFGQWDDIAFSVLTPDIRSDFGVSLSFLASIAVLLAMVNGIVGPLMGWLADRVKRVWMVRVGAILTNLASVGAGLATSVPALVGMRAGAGLARGISDPAGFPLMTDYYPSRVRSRVFASIFAFGALGAVVGPTLAGWLGGHFGWRASLVVLGALATIVSLGSFLLREPVRGEVDRLEAGATEDAAARPQPPMSFAEGWRSARNISTIRKLWVAAPILAIGSAGTALLLAQYWSEVFLLGPQTRGYLATLAAGMGLIALVFAGPVTDRLLRDRPGRVMTILGIVVLGQAVTFFALSYSPFLWLSVAISLPVAFISAMLNPAFITIISLVIPARVRGFGIQTLGWFTLIGLIALPRVIALSDSLGIRKGILFFIPLFVIAGFVLMSAAGGVERDITNARLSSMADQAAEEARRSGKNKMLVIRGLDVMYDGGVQVLFDVDFDVEEGEIVALLGTNGAGKSTLLRAIAGIHEASNGAIFFDGREITHAPPHESADRGVVMMPGGHAVFPTLTVEENLRAACWLYDADEDYCSRRTEEVLELFPRLRERLQTAAGNLSGGEQQMVGLAQALVMQPRLLLIDELSLGLAPAVVSQLLDMLRQIKDQGTTIVIVEQSINVALSVAERAVFMEKGEIHFDGPTSELLARPDLVRSIFMGGAAVGGGRRRRPIADDNAAPVLAVEDVSVQFGGVHALTGVGLEVKAGEIVGIIGPNGAGKTTLFDAISGFVDLTGGTVLVDGVDVTKANPDLRAQLGLARSFQRAELFPALTVRENIAVAFERKAMRNTLLAAAWAPNLRKREAKLYQNVDGLIELMGLTAFANKFMVELSTGSRRAVDVACIMAADPKILLLDEPSSGLAQSETEELGPVITRLVRETGCGVLLIEHDLPLIASVSDRLVAMELGRVVTSGTPAQVTSDQRVLDSYLAADATALSRSDQTSAMLADALTALATTSPEGT
jgi:ABC-type branched-subunit amino acid transport system ATPase component/MFS family permease